MSVEQLVDSTMEALAPYMDVLPKFGKEKLARPPIKLITCIVNGVNKKTDFVTGLYTKEQLKGEFAEREDKLAFFDSLKGYTQIILNQAIDVESKSIITGKEVEKTLIFIQSIIQAAQNPHIPFDQAKAAFKGEAPPPQKEEQSKARPKPKQEAPKEEPKPQPKKQEEPPKEEPKPRREEPREEPKPKGKNQRKKKSQCQIYNQFQNQNRQNQRKLQSQNSNNNQRQHHHQSLTLPL